MECMLLHAHNTHIDVDTVASNLCVIPLAVHPTHDGMRPAHVNTLPKPSVCVRDAHTISTNHLTGTPRGGSSIGRHEDFLLGVRSNGALNLLEPVFELIFLLL